MEFAFEIERLRHNIVVCAKDFDFAISSCCIIDLDIDTKLVISGETYYYSILKQLYYLLLNDNLKLNVTNFAIFKKYWNLSSSTHKKNDVRKYCCWITKITDDEKNKLLDLKVQNIPEDFDLPEEKISQRGCCFATLF